MSRTTAFLEKRKNSEELHLRVFSPVTKAIWVAIVAITVAAEVIPIPLIPPVPFYSYCGAKAICFIVLGYLAPLAFWRFNALNRGILLATISAACVESLQGLLRGGHSFHVYELLIKLCLMLFGFALALDARYERGVSIGRLQIRFTGDHIERRSE